MSCHAVQNHEYLRIMYARSLAVKHLVNLLYGQVNHSLDASYYAVKLIEEARSLLLDYGIHIPDTYIYLNLIPGNEKISFDHVADLIYEALKRDCYDLGKEIAMSIAYSFNEGVDIVYDLVRNCIGIIRRELLKQHG